MKYTAISLATMFVMAFIFALLPSCAFKSGEKEIVVDASVIRVIEIISQK